MPHYARSTGRKPLRSWHGDTDARRAEEADQRRPADKQTEEAMRVPNICVELRPFENGRVGITHYGTEGVVHFSIDPSRSIDALIRDLEDTSPQVDAAQAPEPFAPEALEDDCDADD